MNKMSSGDFQKLLHIALQSLAIQQTLLENQAAELNEELRTLERDEALEKLDVQLLKLRSDYEHYRSFIDPNIKINLEDYYE